MPCKLPTCVSTSLGKYKLCRNADVFIIAKRGYLDLSPQFLRDVDVPASFKMNEFDGFT